MFFCWGSYSATEVNLLARLAVEDHASSPQELQALARLGSSGNCFFLMSSNVSKMLLYLIVFSGKYPNHCHEELMALLRRQFPGLPQPEHFPLYLRSSKKVEGKPFF